MSKDNPFADVFSQLMGEEEKEEKKTVEDNSSKDYTNVNTNSNTIKDSDTKGNTKTDSKGNSNSNNKDSENDITIIDKNSVNEKVEDNPFDDIQSMLNVNKKKKPIKETHTGRTFFIENNLLKEFDKIMKDKDKTKTINLMIQAIVDGYNSHNR